MTALASISLICAVLLLLTPLAVFADHNNISIDYKCKDKVCIIEVSGTARSLVFNNEKVAEDINGFTKFTYPIGDLPFGVEWQAYGTDSPTQYDTPTARGHFIVTKPVTYFPDKQTNWSEKKLAAQFHGFFMNMPICSYALSPDLNELDFLYGIRNIDDLFDFCLETTITIIQYNFYRIFFPILYPY